MKKIISFVLCVCCLSVFVLTGCENVLNKNERIFVRYYNFYAKEKIDFPMVITNITEYVDGWGGTVVYFDCLYENSPFSHKTTMQMVISNVTFNYDAWSGMSIIGDARNYNGVFIEAGFVSRSDDANKGDQEIALSYWKRYQGEPTEAEYNLDLINKKINS